MGQINIGQVLVTAKEDLRITSSSENDPFLEKRINDAALHLGVLENTVIKCATLDVDCNKATLPDDYIEWICLNANGCTGGCSCSAGVININTGTANEDVNTFAMGGFCGCPQYWVASQKVLTDFCGAGLNSAWYYANYFAVQDGIISFPSNVVATQVTIYYKAWNQDTWGLMKIDSLYERALAAYACYKFLRAYPERDTGRRMNDFKQEWVDQKNFLKGDSQVRFFRQYKAQIASIINALMLDHSQYAGR